MSRKIYISGSITNNPNYREDFSNAEMKILDKFIESEWEYGEIINPAKLSCVLPSDFTYDEYMAMDLFLLTKCKAIYMLKGYEESPGAIAELIVAKQLGLEIFYESEEQNNE